MQSVVVGWPCLARRSVSLDKKNHSTLSLLIRQPHSEGERRKREDSGNEVAHSSINGYLLHTAEGTQGMDQHPFRGEKLHSIATGYAQTIWATCGLGLVWDVTVIHQGAKRM